MATQNSELTVATEILNQLGGRKFLFATGSKNLAGDNKGLQMHLTTNKAKAKYLRIDLNANDTYTMTFTSMGKTSLIEKAKIENVYGDMLQKMFTETTGLYINIF